MCQEHSMILNISIMSICIKNLLSTSINVNYVYGTGKLCHSLLKHSLQYSWHQPARRHAGAFFSSLPLCFCFLFTFLTNSAAKAYFAYYAVSQLRTKVMSVRYYIWQRKKLNSLCLKIWIQLMSKKCRLQEFSIIQYSNSSQEGRRFQ